MMKTNNKQQQHKMTPYHAPKRRSLSAIACSIPLPPRFAHQPGQNRLWMLQSFHNFLQFVLQFVNDGLEIFDHAKLLPFGIPWLFRTNHHKPGSCLQTTTNDLISTSHQLPPSKFAAHSLHSIVFSAFYDMRIKWMPAAAIQKANADTNADHHHAP